MINSESIALKLDHLETKIKKLLELYYHAQEDLKDCKNENEVLRKQLDLKNEELKNFQNQYKISKIANVVVDDKKLSSEYKLKINEYIKEIEKGLAYLNKL
jgi:predicted  nucleic acid-binding Zn-ribbon protein